MFGVTAVTTAAGLLDPGVARALVRSPEFFAGQWWRLVSPVLVHPEGWHQVILAGLMLPVLGATAERVFGPVRWIALYGTGAVTGNLAGHAAGSYSAGSSVAVAGLLGGLAVWVLTGRAGLRGPLRIGAGVLPSGGVALAVLGDVHGAPLLAGSLVGLVLLRGMPDVPSFRDLDT